MVAFVVSVNGQRVRTIGIGNSGVLGAHVSWVGHPGAQGELRLGLGGLDSHTDEHCRWPEPPGINLGDTVTIEVVETESVDPPTARMTPAQLVEQEQALMAELEASRKARLATGEM